MSRTAITCVFCSQSNESSSEHLISEWTGCKIAVDGLVCRRCNSRFGSGPEGELHRLLLPFDALLRPSRSRRSKQQVWHGEVRGETRPFRIDLSSGHAQPTSPIVFKEERPEGHTEYRVSGTEEQITEVKGNLERKMGPTLFEHAQDPVDGEIELSATYDWGGLYRSGPLCAIAKFAANYSWWVLGDQPVSLALSKQAFRFLELEAEPAGFVAPICSFDLLNKLNLSPPGHLLMIVPTESRGVYCVVVVLFGIVPYIVRTNPTAQKLDVVQAHRFGVTGNEPADQKLAICGSPKLDLDSLWPVDERARNLWIRQIASNVHDQLVILSEKHGFGGLGFEQILSE